MVVGFIYSRSEHLWVLLVPSMTSPFLAFGYFSIEPLNPYRDLLSRVQGIDLQTSEQHANAQHLITVLNSREAKMFNLRLSCVISILLGAYVLIVAALQHPITLSFDPTDDLAWIVMASFLFWAFSIGIQRQFLLRWAFARLELEQN